MEAYQTIVDFIEHHRKLDYSGFSRKSETSSSSSPDGRSTHTFTIEKIVFRYKDRQVIFCPYTRTAVLSGANDIYRAAFSLTPAEAESLESIMEEGIKKQEKGNKEATLAFFRRKDLPDE